jgi:hypothetical protein
MEREATARFRHRLEALALGTAGVAGYSLVYQHGSALPLTLASFGAAALLLGVSLTVVRDPPSVKPPTLQLTLPMVPPSGRGVGSMGPPAPDSLRAPRRRPAAGRDEPARWPPG